MKVMNVTKNMIKSRQKGMTWYMFKEGEAKEVPDDFELQSGLEKQVDIVKEVKEVLKVEKKEEPKEEGFLDKVTKRGKKKK